MSVYIVSDRHLAYLAEAAVEYKVTWKEPGVEKMVKVGDCEFSSPNWLRAGADRMHGQIGAILLAENTASVNHRYDESEEEEPFVYKPSRKALVPVQILKACQCFAYQSCEHEGWEKSEAFEIVEAIKRHAINHLPGYDKADWSID